MSRSRCDVYCDIANLLGVDATADDDTYDVIQRLYAVAEQMPHSGAMMRYVMTDVLGAFERADADDDPSFREPRGWTSDQYVDVTRVIRTYLHALVPIVPRGMATAVLEEFRRGHP